MSTAGADSPLKTKSPPNALMRTGELFILIFGLLFGYNSDLAHSIYGFKLC